MGRPSKLMGEIAHPPLKTLMTATMNRTGVGEIVHPSAGTLRQMPHPPLKTPMTARTKNRQVRHLPHPLQQRVAQMFHPPPEKPNDGKAETAPRPPF